MQFHWVTQPVTLYLHIASNDVEKQLASLSLGPLQPTLRPDTLSKTGGYPKETELLLKGVR